MMRYQRSGCPVVFRALMSQSHACDEAVPLQVFVPVLVSTPPFSVMCCVMQVSGLTFLRNTFINTTRAYHMGGGRDNVFSNNVILHQLDNDMHTANHAVAPSVLLSPACP